MLSMQFALFRAMETHLMAMCLATLMFAGCGFGGWWTSFHGPGSCWAAWTWEARTGRRQPLSLGLVVLSLPRLRSDEL